MRNTLLLLSVILLAFSSWSQRGKNTNITVTALATQLNAYTTVSADLTAGATSVTVASNNLTNTTLTVPLAAGDLIMIIQMQGATMNVNTDLWTMYNLPWTSPNGHVFDWYDYKEQWGDVTAYNNAGKYELAEVRSVTGSTGITLQCGLKNTYTAAGKVQVVRVPRIQNLVLNPNTSIVPAAWNGTVGGVVALEVNGTLTFGSNSLINATGFGFRGGVTENSTLGSPPGSINDNSLLGTSDAQAGAEKGESIGGWTTEYAALISRYGRGAPANGGGGGGNHNSGGGGGSNVGTGTFTGDGNPQPGYNAIWNLEAPGFAASVSSGGGRGGYSYSTNNQDETVVGPKNTAWSGDYRRSIGGLGGHPLTADVTRIFAGGGGGAGDQNFNAATLSTHGGNGGAGGGIVYLLHYGTTSGTASIEANGAPGQATNPLNTAAPIGQKYGNDGAGGAGGGGAIVISNGTSIPNTITLKANGGAGGNQFLSLGTAAAGEADGPGGGGAGGMIAATASAAIQTVAGGSGGISNSSHVSAFPPNGSTNGASGISGLPNPFFDINASNVTICSGNSTTLTATVVGTLPAGSSVTWYNAQFGGSVLGTGLTYNTGVLATTTTYYVGTCPGTFRKPVVVTVGGPTISGTAVITNVTCSTTGSITGLTTSGGIAPVTITWNSVVTPGMNLTNASAGTYNVLVTDDAGCTATSGPYTITSSGGPTINTTSMVVTPQNCLGTNGSITGITTTGTITSVSWNSGAYSTLNITNIPSGNYTLVVTDNGGCTASVGPINVGLTAGPSINQTNLAVTNASCGLSNGAISGLVASGTSLTLEWNGISAADEDITGLAAGPYTLVVEDNLGCTATAGPFNITNQAGPAIDASGIVISDDHCSQSIGSITGITVSGGTAPVNFSWNAGAYTTLNISALNTGNYTLTVSDNNGCTATSGPHNVANIAGPVINTTGMVITPQSCTGVDGAITGITATGAGTLTYQWNLNAPVAAPDLTGVAAGSYVLIVRDGFNCQNFVGPFVVPGSTPPTINTTNMVVSPETCSADNGSITGITTTGTIASVSWNTGAYTTLDIAGLDNGSYSLTVTATNGCTASAGPFAVANETGPVLNSSSVVIVDDHCSQSEGSVSGISISGGTAPVNLSWNPGSQSTLNISSLTAGSYTLTATDDNGCTATSGPHNVANIAGPAINTTNIDINPETCAGDDGSITGITASGTGMLTYSWNSTPAASTLDLTGVGAGSYTLVVEDAFDCQATAGPFVVSGATPMSLNTTNVVVTNTSCTSSTGSISGLVVVGGINPQIDWSNNATTANISNLAAGNYVVTVTDDQGCTLTEDFDVNTVNGPSIDNFGLTITPEHCNQEDGSLTGLVATGGTAPYSYSWNAIPVVTTVGLINAEAGSYTLTVTDAAGCTATANAVIGSVAEPVIDVSNLVVTDATCSQPNGSANGIQVTGGSAPYTYLWNYQSQSTPNLNAAPGGNYSLTVTDAAGCTAAQAVTIGNIGELNADFSYLPGNPSPGDVVTFIDNSSGSNVAAWNWSIDTVSNAGSGSSVNYTFITEGSYEVTLTVVGDQGCIDSVKKTIVINGEISIPNVITRNNDGLNDVFFIKNLQPESELVILNRWGNSVFVTKDYKNDWEGENMAGEELSEGVYTYQLINAEGKLWQGFVHLIID